jgi:hypothetical protein
MTDTNKASQANSYLCCICHGQGTGHCSECINYCQPPATVAEGSEELDDYSRVLDILVRGIEERKIEIYKPNPGKTVPSLSIDNTLAHELAGLVQQARSTAIPKEEVERAIGEDEVADSYDSTFIEISKEERNRLRAEIRSKLGLGTTNNANKENTDE